MNTTSVTKVLVLIWLVLLLPVNVYSQSTITHGGKKPQTNQQKKKPVEAAGYDVDISCNVPSATILIDGNNYVTANRTLFLKTGSHTLKLTAEGYESLTEYIQVNSRSRSFSFTLQKKTASSKVQNNSNSASTSNSNSSQSSNSNKISITIDDEFFYLMDDRTSGHSKYPRDFNIYDNVMVTIKNAKGKTIWMETRFYDAATHSAIAPKDNKYRTTSNGAGCINSRVIDSDYYCKGELTVTPLSALGLGNGKHHIEVLTFIYVGVLDPNARTTKLVIPAKTLHFSKYGDNVSELTVTESDE